MARYYGQVGFATFEETSPGVMTEKIVERSYKGEVTRIIHKVEGSDKHNDNLGINNQISIVANSFAYENVGFIRYVTWLGHKWKVNEVTVEWPRLTLSIGGVYNEQTESRASSDI